MQPFLTDTHLSLSTQCHIFSLFLNVLSLYKFRSSGLVPCLSLRHDVGVTIIPLLLLQLVGSFEFEVQAGLDGDNEDTNTEESQLNQTTVKR